MMLEDILSPVPARLASPARSVSLDALAGLWFRQIIRVSVTRPAQHDDAMALINRIRGALGSGLMKGASAEAIAGRPCCFEPPCAFDILFREQIRVGGHGLPKPFVISLDIHRNRFIINLTLFGFACDWVESVRDRLIAALVHDVIWLENGRRQTVEIESCTVETLEGVPVPESPERATLDFITPLDATGMDLVETPSTVIARLARRIDGLARWMDAAIDVRWDGISGCWKSADYAFGALVEGRAERGSRRQQKAFANPVSQPVLHISGDLAPLCAILAIGATCHAGRGAVSGFGRFALDWH
jgi:hypothetical protein